MKSHLLFSLLLMNGLMPALAEQSPGNMLATVLSADRQAWQVEPILTVGDQVGDYVLPGVPDGMGMLLSDDAIHADIFINHEMREKQGHAYQLKNGTQLNGARISALRVNRQSARPVSAGLAYDAIVDRLGRPVTSAAQVNERNHPSAGLSRLCSARLVESGSLGFVDDIYLTGEETDTMDSHGRGGSIWALDPGSRKLWAAPLLGRGAWENVTPVAPAAPGEIALLLGDDKPGAPLYLYRGTKQADGNFLARNGLAAGRLYCWRADNGATSPADFHGTGRKLSGSFVPVLVSDATKAGKRGFDSQGFLDSSRMRAGALRSGCFGFSRPEDLHNAPEDPGKIVFSSTGHAGLFSSDVWGTLYILQVDTAKLTASLRILYDGDDKGHRDEGIRSPDNLTWSDDGFVYVQEDNAIGTGAFGNNGMEASIWQIDPAGGEPARIAIVDRSVVLPRGSHDKYAGKLGAWETSGIIDVSRAFSRKPDETVLLVNVQAHGIQDGNIGGKQGLVQSGQLLLLRH